MSFLTPDAVQAVLNHVADRIMGLPLATPRVAVDGPDDVGKTLFAEQLVNGHQSGHANRHSMLPVPTKIAVQNAVSAS